MNRCQTQFPGQTQEDESDQTAASGQIEKAWGHQDAMGQAGYAKCFDLTCSSGIMFLDGEAAAQEGSESGSMEKTSIWLFCSSRWVLFISRTSILSISITRTSFKG